MNVCGAWRVCNTFSPLLTLGGRIVNISSDEGPSFIEKCCPTKTSLLLNPLVSWNQLCEFMDNARNWEKAKTCHACGWKYKSVSVDCDCPDCKDIVFECECGCECPCGCECTGDAYGLSKACLNTLTVILARLYPHLAVNACTPGITLTDMTRVSFRSQLESGISPTALGMRTPEQGAYAAVCLIFGSLDGSGKYYGADGLRSPLDRYFLLFSNFQCFYKKTVTYNMFRWRRPGELTYHGD